MSSFTKDAIEKAAGEMDFFTFATYVDEGLEKDSKSMITVLPAILEHRPELTNAISWDLLRSSNRLHDEYPEQVQQIFELIARLGNPKESWMTFCEIAEDANLELLELGQRLYGRIQNDKFFDGQIAAIETMIDVMDPTNVLLTVTDLFRTKVEVQRERLGLLCLHVLEMVDSDLALELFVQLKLPSHFLLTHPSGGALLLLDESHYEPDDILTFLESIPYSQVTRPTQIDKYLQLCKVTLPIVSTMCATHLQCLTVIASMQKPPLSTAALFIIKAYLHLVPHYDKQAFVMDSILECPFVNFRAEVIDLLDGDEEGLEAAYTQILEDEFRVLLKASNVGIRLKLPWLKDWMERAQKRADLSAVEMDILGVAAQRVNQV